MTKYKIVLSDDIELVAEVNRQLQETRGYCPCALEWNEDTKCCCKALLHFGALKNNVELKKAIKDEYLTAYETALLTAAKEIHNAINMLQNEFKRNQSAKSAYQKMKQVARLNWQKYKQGLIPYAYVLDSEQRKLSAQTNMVNSNAALYQGIVGYYKAIGGWVE